MTEPKRIFVVDDEPGFTRLLKVALEQTGHYEVREENVPERARATAREFLPDLLLVDVIMPGMDGGDVVAQIHDELALQNVPAVFLTASVLKEEIESRGGAIGGFPFVAKPVSTEVLIETIERTLAAHEHTGGLV